jgi:lysophospholipase L1-like esterase
MKRLTLALLLLVVSPLAARSAEPAGERHFLYVVAPGIRNYLEFGGAGVIVFDMDRGHAFVRRIETPASHEAKPENIKGVCACPATRKLYFTTLKKLFCVDLVTEKTLWEKELPGGCDRMAMTPDGRRLFVPSLEGPHWNVVDGETGDRVGQVRPDSGSHNTVCSLDGQRAYLAGLRSPVLTVIDTKSNEVVQRVGPFSAPIRPFTVNGDRSRVFVNVNDLLGFEVGDLTTGQMLYRVEVQGFEKGPTKRHGCPSHGVGLTPDEKEIWVCDAHNSRLHVFDATATPPKQTVSIPLREQPGWVTFSLDGRYAYPSTGEVIDAKSKAVLTALTDEQGRPVHSEKMVEVVFRDGVPVGAGDQFGLGRAQRADDTANFARWEKEIAAYEKQDREKPPAKGGIVCVGSSTVRLWNLAKSFPGVDAINRGFGGSQLADSVHFAPRLVLKHEPRLVVLYAGDNDLAAGKTPEQVAADFRAFAEAVHRQLPKTRILYIAIKPSVKRWNLIDKARAANAMIEEACKKDERLTIIDLGKPLLGEDGRPKPELFRADGLHLNEKGYALWAAALQPYLK